MALKRPPLLADYHEVIWYELDVGGGSLLPTLRDRIEQEKEQWNQELLADLEKHDEYLLDHVLVTPQEEIWPSLLEDHPDQPLERWWWHLGKLRRGEYPLELLPEPLRRVVEEAKKGR